MRQPGCQPHQESSFNLKLLQLPYVGLGPVCRWILKHHQVHHDIRSPRCITGESASVAKNWTTCSRAPPGLSLSFVPAATLLNGCSPQMPHLLFFSGEQLMRREFSAAGQCPSIARVVEHCESSGRVSVVVLTLYRLLLQPGDHNPQCGVHTPQSREMRGWKERNTLSRHLVLLDHILKHL